MKIKLSELRQIIREELELFETLKENQRFIRDDGSFDMERCEDETTKETGITNTRPVCKGAAIVYAEKPNSDIVLGKKEPIKHTKQVRKSVIKHAN